MLTFLDIIVGQVRAARQATGARLPLLFMNSFRTRDDTLAALERYPDVAVDGLPVDFLQNREPKLLSHDLTPSPGRRTPTSSGARPGTATSTRRCTPPASSSPSSTPASATCASPTPTTSAPPPTPPSPAGSPPPAPPTPPSSAARRPPTSRAASSSSARQTAASSSARPRRPTPTTSPCPSTPTRHPFFHTNNLWFDLEALAAELERTSGVLELPLIRNDKTVDPADSSSPEVVQIESAMGAAVAVFEGATAIEVERSRFLPVKTTNDLLVLRSDVYALTADYRLEAQAPAPLVDLDKDHYKLIDGFTERFAAGAPSLRDADSLTVRGDWTFGSGVRAEGKAALDGRRRHGARRRDGRPRRVLTARPRLLGQGAALIARPPGPGPTRCTAARGRTRPRPARSRRWTRPGAPSPAPGSRRAARCRAAPSSSSRSCTRNSSA